MHSVRTVLGNAAAAILILFIIATVSFAQDVSEITKEDLPKYVDYVKKNAQPPQEYVVSKMDHYNILIIGEMHQVKEYCKFIASVIEPLYRERGLRYFATEFVKSKYKDDINKLVTADTFDRELALKIIRNYAWDTFGFKEYLDIYKAIWQVNKNRPEGKEPLEILPLDDDWSQWDRFFGPKKDDRMYAFQQNLDREKHLVESFTQNYTPGTKAIVHIGNSHASRKQEPRFAAELYKKYGDSMFQITLHLKIFSRAKRNLSRFLEEVMDEAGNAPSAFDVKDSPFAAIADKDCPFFRFPVNKGLYDLMQGFIFIKPLDKLTKVAWIDNFITDEHYAHARDIAEKMRWIEKGTTPLRGELNQILSTKFDGKSPYFKRQSK